MGEFLLGKLGCRIQVAGYGLRDTSCVLRIFPFPNFLFSMTFQTNSFRRSETLNPEGL